MQLLIIKTAHLHRQAVSTKNYKIMILITFRWRYRQVVSLPIPKGLFSRTILLCFMPLK